MSGRIDPPVQVYLIIISAICGNVNWHGYRKCNDLYDGNIRLHIGFVVTCDMLRAPIERLHFTKTRDQLPQRLHPKMIASAP